ncbi:hypothetical protein BO94DRAFT_582400 [Aspergillus sclerotioniger CBS 115572]|uniref:Uncharacterized protein n=1 Tax=Aspergillus sclerotioniger CBS 115572 TaxID=1450535 RepID=A0A317X8T1_9EURO|nr:hypothetical protein BO94DRAFT_582400 [Aspergillus sclerotioniger CBS 115572]PWY93987.1 hypothetical protein BO94DRAFT_582400 [Aspergillus sclerotioniger CBS 115572]
MSPSGTQISLDDLSHRSSRPRPSQEDNRQLLPSSASSTSSRRGSSDSTSRASNAGLQPDASNNGDHSDSDSGVTAESHDDSESDDSIPLRTTEKRKWRWKHLVMDSGTDEPYQLHDDSATLTRLVFLRLVAVTIIIGAIVLGARGQSFDLASHTVENGIVVDQDAQLAIIGLANTILQFLTQEALLHISATLITKWMTGKGEKGASSVDFDLLDEFKKPWTAASKLKERCKIGTRKSRAWLQFIGALVVGISILLLGAAMNTIAIPKSRWWPDTRFEAPQPPDDRFYFVNQTSRVASVSRMPLWGQAWEMIREGGTASWEMAHTLAAYRSLNALSKLYDTFNNEAGWQSIGDNDAPTFSAIEVTNASTPSIRSMAMHGDLAIAMYNQQKAQNSHSWARDSTGWYARLFMPGILLDTSCIPNNDTLATGSWTATTSSTNSTITVTIGPATNTSTSTGTFNGAICYINVYQAQVALQQWFYSGTGNYDYSINNYGADMYPEISYLDPPSTTETLAISTETTSWFEAIIPNLQAFSTNKEVLNLTSLAVLLADDLVSFNRGYSQLDGLAAVISTIFTDMVTSFDWTYAVSSGNTTMQGPIRWQIYGSGPRLPWEWVIAIVLGVGIGVQVYDLVLLGWWRGLAKGPWLSLDGMLVAANKAPMMKVLQNGKGGGYVSDEARQARFFVRQLASDLEGQREGDAVLVSGEELQEEEGMYVELQPGKAYREQATAA